MRPERASKARRTSSVVAERKVVWRDGIQLTASKLWCDAARAVDVCFVSSADVLRGKVRHGQLITTPETVALLGVPPAGHLLVPNGRFFALGHTRLELFPTGVGPGASGLRVDHGGSFVMYAGAVQPLEATRLGATAEMRRADVVVVAAHFSDRKHKLLAPKIAAPRLAQWAEAQVKAQRFAVVLADSPHAGMQLAMEMRAAGMRVAAHSSICTLLQRLRGALRKEQQAFAEAGSVKVGQPSVVVWPVQRRAVLVRRLAGRGVATAWVSGDAVSKAAAQRMGTELALPWATSADCESLLGWLEQTRAKEVYVTGRAAQAVAEILGKRASALGPPEQMPLFR